MSGGINSDANLVPLRTCIPGAVLSTKHSVTRRTMGPRSGLMPPNSPIERMLFR